MTGLAAFLIVVFLCYSSWRKGVDVERGRWNVDVLSSHHQKYLAKFEFIDDCLLHHVPRRYLRAEALAEEPCAKPLPVCVLLGESLGDRRFRGTVLVDGDFEGAFAPQYKLLVRGQEVASCRILRRRL